jgi:hypothetical protein
MAHNDVSGSHWRKTAQSSPRVTIPASGGGSADAGTTANTASKTTMNRIRSAFMGNLL